MQVRTNKKIVEALFLTIGNSMFLLVFAILWGSALLCFLACGIPDNCALQQDFLVSSTCFGSDFHRRIGPLNCLDSLYYDFVSGFFGVSAGELRGPQN